MRCALLEQPFGEALLAALALGLLCFAGWRLLQAIWNPDHLGVDFTSLARRVIWFGSALFYLAFAWVTFAMIVGSDRVGNAPALGAAAGRWPKNGTQKCSTRRRCPELGNFAARVLVG